jgi:transposase
MTMPSMPEPVSDDQDDNSAAEEIVLGVDTHKDIHVAAVITSLGVLRESTPFPATAAGYQALLAWAGTFGVLRRAGVECTGSYGAALARHLRAAGIEVIEVNQPDKATAAGRARLTASMPNPPPERCSATGPAAARRPVTGRWRCCGVFKLAKASAL